MKKRKTLKSPIKARSRKETRYFSEAARKAILDEIESGLSKSEASRRYQVSQTAIYKWIKMYSDDYALPLVKVVEHQSDSQKNKLLSKELSQTYESLGRLQTENMFLQKIIELANDHFDTDLKKTFENKFLPFSTNAKNKSQ